MKVRTLMLAMLGGALLGACGGTEVVTEVSLEQEEGEATPLSGVAVYLLPYDRDAIFDSLAQAHGEPEPPIPDSILRLQEEIAVAQDQWQEAESRWNTVRDSLKQISDRLRGMSRASPDYVRLFRAFNELEAQESEAQRRSQEAFQRFTRLQSVVAQQSEEIRLLREQWAEEAFAGVDEAIDARLKELNREEQVDTTGSRGIATFQPRPGAWWVHARYELPYSELYWNERIEVASGDSTHVSLNRESAEVRPKL